jgi:polyhydroxybutyrate depolymerase
LANVQTWATYNGASGPVTDPLPFLDLTTDVAGLDTVRTRYTNFPPGGAIELWTIMGGSHSPTLSPQFSPRVIDWLLAHPKP